jgi:hypothetical protein
MVRNAQGWQDMDHHPCPWSSGMVGRSNKEIEAVSHALVVHDKETKAESLYVFTAYTATPHGNMGFTPQKLFYSQCMDPLLPIDCMYGTDDRTVPQCYSSYVFGQRHMAMQMAEKVREVAGRAVEIQMEQQSRKVKHRRYQVGDQVMLYSPPNARDKLHSMPWTGPHEIVEVADDHTVRIRMFCGPAKAAKCKARQGRHPSMMNG